MIDSRDHRQPGRRSTDTAPTAADRNMIDSICHTLNTAEEVVDDNESPYAYIYGALRPVLPMPLLLAVEAFLIRREMRVGAVAS